jgi:hypothetical protein
MQISVKTPPELSLPLLEKCAAYGTDSPSHFLQDCVWQCVQWMDTPHRPFHPLPMVEKYYRAMGREDELLSSPKKKQDEIVQRLTDEDKRRRAKEAAQRLADFHALIKKQPVPKHLHLKISQGMGELPQRVKAKAKWLHVAANALIVACLRDCLDAMDDPKKALVPPPVVVEFWTASHAKLRPKPKGVDEAMVLETYEAILRKRGGPILDTIVRLALSEQWDTSLEQILRDADVITKDREMKSRLRPLRR